MGISQLTAISQVALAQIRVALSDIAPEIPETEILPTKNIFTDLHLDLLSKWALANEIEKIAKIEISDANITAAQTIADFMDILATSDVTKKLAAEEKITIENMREENQIDTTSTAEFSSSSIAKSTSLEIDPDSPQLATAEDIATLFNEK